MNASITPSGLRNRKDLGHYQPGEMAAVAAVVASVTILLLAAILALAGVPPLSRLSFPARCMLGGAALAAVFCALYGMLIEARTLAISRISLTRSKIRGEPLLIAHLSDLHVRAWSGLEEAVLRETARAQPDLILLSGDYTARPGVPADARRLIAELARIAPIFACRGNAEYRRPPFRELFEGTGARLLLNEAAEVEVKATPVSVLGVDPGEEERVRALGREIAADRLSLCLYHYPDLVPEIAALPFDLMLCGHTHGGQVRLPWIGAVVTLCRAGTRYAAGLFGTGERQAYGSRGGGCESYGIPPIRFLCPPELALIELRRP